MVSIYSLTLRQSQVGKSILSPSISLNEAAMRFFIVSLIVVTAAGVAGAQSITPAKLPPDIHADSLSRLPVVKRESLDEEGKRIYDVVVGPNRTGILRGPGGISLH